MIKLSIIDNTCAYSFYVNWFEIAICKIGNREISNEDGLTRYVNH